MSEITLEQAVKQFALDHKKDFIYGPAKQVPLDLLSYRTQETDSGLKINDETYESRHADLRVYSEKKYYNSYLAIHKSRQKDTGYEIQILHFLFIGPERGCCVSKINLGECEDEGVDIIWSKPVKVSAEEAVRLYASGSYMLRVKVGGKYQAPPITTLNYGME